MDTGKKLLLISFSSIPAADRHSAIVTGTVRALGRLFESIDIVAVKGDYLAHIERYHNCRLLRVPLVGDTPRERAESFRRAVKRQIESDTYDVIHLRSPLEAHPLCEEAGEKGYRVVFEAGTFAVQDALQNDDLDEVSQIDEQFSLDEINCANLADQVIVSSEAAKATLRGRGVSKPIDIIPAGVNIDAFDWEMTAEPPVPTILCLGRVAPWRDTASVMEAVRRALEVLPIRLRWIGEPNSERREAFSAYAADMGLTGVISFEAPTDTEDLPLLISSATVCLAPASPGPRYTEWGDQPTGLLEYMACRRPVIAARAAGVEEIVRDGAEAMLYTPGDPDSLTSAILFLLRNPRHRELLAKRGYHRVREQFCESAQRRGILEVYANLLGVQQHPPSPLVNSLDDAASSKALASVPVDSQEPITAVMEVADESRQVKIDGDTRRVRSVHEPVNDVERLDTQPNYQLEGRAQADTPPPSDEEWVLPETTPHAKRPTDAIDAPPSGVVESSQVANEDTSRIMNRDTQDDSGQGPDDI